MLASLLLVLVSLCVASAQLATTNFDFMKYANNSINSYGQQLEGVQQTLVQIASPLSYNSNGQSGQAAAGSFLLYGGGTEPTAIIPISTSTSTNGPIVNPIFIGSPVGVLYEVGCATRTGSNVFYIIGTPASSVKNQTNDTFYVYRSTDAVTFTNVLDAATTQLWMSRNNEDSTMCVVATNGNVYSVGSEDTWGSSNQGQTFTKVALTGSRFSPRTFFAGGIYTTSAGVDTIMVLGGRDANSAASPYGGADHNDVWSSTNYGASWSQLTAAAAWSARDQHSWAISSTGLQVVFGGDVSGGYGQYDSDMWYSYDGASWTLLKGVTSIGNYSECEMMFDNSGYLYLFGGQTNGYNWLYTSVRTTVPISTTSGNLNAADHQFTPSLIVLITNVVIAALSWAYLA